MNQFRCSCAAYRCRTCGPNGSEEDKQELTKLTSMFHIINLDLDEIDGTIRHFANEIDMTGLEDLEGTIVGNIKPQAGRFAFNDGPGTTALTSGRLLTVNNTNLAHTKKNEKQYDRWKNRILGPRDREDWLGELGRLGNRRHQAPSETLRLPWSFRCDRVG